MFALYNQRRLLFILGVALAGVGCARQSPGPNPEASKKSDPYVAVVQVAPHQALPEFKGAIEKARRLWEQGRPDEADFTATLSSVSAGFAEIQPAREGGKPQWYKVRLNAAGARFDAIRFSNALPQPADLTWAFAAPGNPRLSWGIAGTGSKQPRGFTDFQRKENLKLADIDLPDRNTVVFQQLDGGQIGPGEQVLFFVFESGEPIDMYVRARLDKSARHFATAAELAKHLDLELPLRSTRVVAGRGNQDGAAILDVAVQDMPPNMKLSLDEAWGLQKFSMVDLRKFAATITRVRSGFAEIPVSRDGETPRWTRVRLNALGAHFDAIRFTNPFDYRADLIWVFALSKEGEMRWDIVGQDGRPERSFRDFGAKENLKLPGLDLPDRNTVIFQQLDEGAIAPGREYYVWFTFAQRNPVDMYVRLKLLKPDPAKRPHFAKTHSIAELLGLEVPFRFTEAATPADRAAHIEEHRRRETGVETAVKRRKPADRIAWFSMAKSMHDAGIELESVGPRENANSRFLEAASRLRKFRLQYPDLDDEEKQLLQAALFNEARVLARTGKTEKALTSLREALQAGFKDLPQVLKDDDLRSVRALPAFDALLKEQGVRRPSEVKE